ncbi:FtsX-like permease family protein [Scytonema sp. UIC 10036]|uniref:ABC transporter permease DevC n=1 Tax=Scytonema sp. UIC 10036 TaxID=2304196 RepID=UPI0012DA3E78|nr:ABC transporter permease DevC [Scytonema sp. UIC 10036]MUH01017.1 FtsX-like permease family protein [Scytonema sp. UIC 10036]
MKLPHLIKSLQKNIDFETPLAWAQLSHQKVRLAVATTGVCFANILMFTQLGLLAMLTDGTTKLHESLTGDLVLVSSFSPSLFFRISFPRAYLYQAAAVDGVVSASPIYIGRANWVNPNQLSSPQANANKARSRGPRMFGNEVRVIALNPAQPPVLNIPEVNQQIAKLAVPDAVLFDRLSQASLGDISKRLEKSEEVATLMDNRRTFAVGLFSMGSTINDKGNVIMSDWTYAQRFGQNSLKQIRLGVLTLEKGADIKTVQERLSDRLPDDVAILTHEELIQRERQFHESQPEGIILKFGTLVGFVVGVIILYQVLYADINDHLSEYATLKAMGYSDKSLLMVVLQEAIILGFMGFIPGFISSLGIYQLLATLTRIPLTMKVSVALQVFILTLVMCSISGAIATSKLRSADPADVF